MISIALPKGRLGTSVYERLAAIGYSCPEMEEDNRQKLLELMRAQGLEVKA